MTGLAVLADHLAGTLELARHALVGGDDLVERVGDLAGEAGLVARQPHREIAVAHRLQRAQQLAHVERRSRRGLESCGRCRSSCLGRAAGARVFLRRAGA